MRRLDALTQTRLAALFRFPSASEVALRRVIAARLASLREVTGARVVRTLAARRKGIEAREARQDATLEQDLRAFGGDIEAVRAGWAELGEEGSDFDALLQVGSQVDRLVTKRIRSAYTASVRGRREAPELTPRVGEVADFARINARLIRTLESDTLDAVAASITEGLRQGWSTEEIGDVVADRFGAARNHAALIARDQVGTLNGQLNGLRQTSLGIESYTWSSSGDTRVRPLHQELDGQRFTWETGHPTEGHPGEPVGCRCVALPHFE